MNKTESYINSVNLNKNTDFPYLVLNVKNDKSFPLNPGFRVMHWHEYLQFIYVINGKITVRTLEEKVTIGSKEVIFINKKKCASLRGKTWRL